MPDFTLRPTAGATIVDWKDPASGSKPSRLNVDSWPHRYYKAVAGVAVTIKATPSGGVEGALDGALSGRLFSSWVAESPGGFNLSSAAGNTSVATFTPGVVGHYLVVFRRPGGGAIGLHITAEAS